ncbi:hypothetical protein CTAYLR_000024 [Chrysophaeum taylorii]|uniref:Uncharacterized protein n=1 Tax=Chrysophaeum taylorii TaxID=2483200 RepID=A0AAD7XNC5_9STRA|nr:hypothetical protein CTAYLR_000024 [Chrysophaeum taylorii]
MMKSFAVTKKKKKQGRKLAATLPAFSPMEDSEPPARRPKPTKGGEEEAQRYQDKGNARAQAGDFAAALPNFDAAIALAPTAARFELRAQTLLALDRDFEATLAGESAVELAPEWSEAHLALARARLNLGEIDAAFESFTRAAALDPSNNDELRACDDLRRAVDAHRRRDKLRAENATESDLAEVLRCKASLRRAQLPKPRDAFVPLLGES